MSRKRCFFIGHKDAPQSLLEKLKIEVKRLVDNEGVSEFVIGGYGAFDAMASFALIEVKSEFPSINILRLTPYYETSHPPNLPAGFDGMVYPEGLENVPKRFCIARANQYMIEHSDYLICYICRSFGSSSKLLEFASRKEKKGQIQIIRL